MSGLSSRLRIILSIFILTTVILAVNGWFLYGNVQTLEKQQGWVNHTHEVITEIELINSGLKSVETSQRGYLLRNQFQFLSIYQDSIKELWSHFSRLKILVSDNSDQLNECSRLEAILKSRLLTLGETLEIYRSTGKITNTFNTGQDFSEAVRRQAEYMISREEVLLQNRIETVKSQRTFLILSLAGSTLFGILIALATYILVRRQFISQDADDQRRIRQQRMSAIEAAAAKIAVIEGGVRRIGEAFVRYLCENTGSLAANLYLESEGVLQISAGYLIEDKDGLSKLTIEMTRRNTFKFGEGLVGRAVLSEALEIIEDVPADYFTIQSSFGERKPSVLVMVPIVFQGERFGAVELASFAKPNHEQTALLEVAVKAIAGGLAKARNQERQQQLLEETQRQSEELQMQQEELRTTNEELEEQAKALTQAQARSQLQTEELRQMNEELEQQTKILEAQQQTLSIKNQALETSRRTLEEKAKEIERTSAYKSEFMAKMSHELRTPLNSLMILATILQENKKGNLDDQQVEFARTIYEAGTDLLDLINDILDLSKIEAKKLQVKAEALNVRQFLDQISALFVPQAEARGLKLRVDVADDVPAQMTTDRQRLQQILRNLIGNAMKFTETGAITLLASVTKEKKIAISVQDTGIGIPPEKIRLIWEAFEQADGSISRRFGGTGLGLTISRELTQLLSGEINVSSESGKGSRFTVQLPIELKVDEGPANSVVSEPMPSSAPSDRLTPPKFEPAATVEEATERAAFVERALADVRAGDRTILVVEDDPKFSVSVAEAVRMQSFVPLCVSDGETALELLKKHTPLAILLDIHLPGINGLALLDVIKKNPTWRGVPIHMISALERQQSALRMGAIGYLAKPVTIDGVRGALSRIENVLERKVKRLLVVEDDSRQRSLISDLLAGADVEISAIGTGKEALEVLKSLGADCVVLDLKLPDMTGFELLEKLDSQRGLSLPPIIIYTGKDLNREEEDRLRRYSDSIIIKGAKSPERLLDEVSLFIHRIEADLPQDKRAMLNTIRGKDRHFDGRSLLLVDDDLRNLFALTSALESKGFEIAVARDGLEAIEKLETGPRPDLILMDIMMPRMDGFEAMKRIRANVRYRDLPIVALTAKAMAGEHERCVQAGASDYLPKPIDLTNLLSVLKVWLPAEGIMS